ncbi:CAP domain-containing protein [Gilvimarinus japonicus]|uniref:CAP domain-containing protein n=1 Tax=Gilvimarinus japonicus TaxID=1796469 RepID=A0ABV7HLZ7_9GAMM
MISAPDNLKAGAGNREVRLDWQAVDNADRYLVFFASEANFDPLNIGAYRDGDWQQAKQPPFTVSGLDNGTTYYFVITAVRSGKESDASARVSATPSRPSAPLNVSAAETLMVELINQARFNPSAEATRFGIDLNEGLTPGTLSNERRPPLAYNELLMFAARTHSQWMLDTDTFSHSGAANSSVTDRIAAEGYTLSGSWTAGENISVSGASRRPDPVNAVISQHQGLFKSPGHRVNILNAGYRELGVGQRSGEFTFSSGAFPSSMISQNFARHGSDYFVSGVVYRDSDNNGRYSAAEGVEGVTVSVGDASTTSGAAGAYTIARPKGTYNVAAFGDDIGLTTDSVTLNNRNKKLDIIINGTNAQLTVW